MRFWEGKFEDDWMNDDAFIDLRLLISRNVIRGKSRLSLAASRV